MIKDEVRVASEKYQLVEDDDSHQMLLMLVAEWMDDELDSEPVTIVVFLLDDDESFVDELDEAIPLLDDDELEVIDEMLHLLRDEFDEFEYAVVYLDRCIDIDDDEVEVEDMREANEFEQMDDEIDDLVARV